MFCIPGPSAFANKLGQWFFGDCALVWSDLLPVAHFLLLERLSGLGLWDTTLLWLLIHGASGYWVSFTALIATHHSPRLFHAGDDPAPTRDWGLQQMDSVRDVDGKSR